MSDEPMTRELAAFEAWWNGQASKHPMAFAAIRPAKDIARLFAVAAWSHQQSEIDRLTRALTDEQRRVGDAQFSRDSFARQLDDLQREIARLTEEQARDRRIVAAHAKCDPSECTVIVGLSIVHGYMPTEPHSALTTPTEEKA